MRSLRTVSDWVMYTGMAISMYGGAQWPRPSWLVVAVGVVIVFVGVIIRRRAGAPMLHAEEIHGSDLRRPARTGTLIDALGALRDGIQKLHIEGANETLEVLKGRIEELLWIGPERVGGSQEAIAAKVGFAVYAEVMTPLAASERWLNRAWSAAADGHRPECLASLVEALDFAKEAEELGQKHFVGLG